MLRRLALVAVVLVSGCTAGVGGKDVGLEDLSLTSVAPTIIVPGTAIAIGGASFASSDWGTSSLHLVGTAGGNAVDVSWAADFVDYQHMTVAVDAAQLLSIGGDVDFVGSATIDVVSVVDGGTYTTAVLPVSLTFKTSLIPKTTTVQTGTVIFVNDEIQIEGSGFLLGGGEGNTVAQLNGCFTLANASTCTPISQIEIPLVPSSPFDRTKATFPFQPQIAGISPGAFTGTIVVVNEPTVGDSISAFATEVSYTMVAPQIFQVNPNDASLGQYVFVAGGGFVGGSSDSLTELHLVGSFQKAGVSTPGNVDMILIPDFVDGQLVRYVVNEDDALGHALNLRTDTGTFTGTITPVTSFGQVTVTGESTAATFGIAPIRQVVYLDFESTYIEGLRLFGLRAIDQQIQDRIMKVVANEYTTVNMDFRTAPPTDFALFEWVELVGVDPNGEGLFGYDNSPGKDVGNARLYDRIGGVNAQTQADGYAGYGGVFVESFLGFSNHPPAQIMTVEGSDPTFDLVLDPFREDQGGAAVTAADLGTFVPPLSDGAGCPATDRPTQIACAAFVMGNILGDTLAHEIGHSLGLANPYGDGFHDPSDEPNRLMDAGGDRPFLERAELGGQGPALFCADEYTYLRTILPVAVADDPTQRPDCN